MSARTNGPEPAPLFRSYFLGGFECSTHRTRAGKRLDLIAATGHDRLVRADYERLQAAGIRAAREGLRWHLIETSAGRYDFSSVLPMLRAARETGVQVIWDLCHYGWPDGLDVFSPEFARRFAGLARAFTALLADESDDLPYLAPVNEISFLAWAGGGVAMLPPFATGRGDELKKQLVRATLEGIEAVWSVNPRARIFHIDPMCNVVADPEKPDEGRIAEEYRTSQYEVWDMVSGRLHPELGGAPKYLDVVGVNYYIDNQWVYPGDEHSSTTIFPSHPYYRPVWDMLREVYERYGRPLFIAETGIEGDARPSWLRSISEEVRAALKEGVPVEGICLYPILNHPGWEDDRYCRNGLWDYPTETGEREIYAPMAEELSRQQALFRQMGH
jgi:beta-glucosidase/6-phospho-beta-glucosidase/beta-galactosidase